MTVNPILWVSAGKASHGAVQRRAGNPPLANRARVKIGIEKKICPGKGAPAALTRIESEPEILLRAGPPFDNPL